MRKSTIKSRKNLFTLVTPGAILYFYQPSWLLIAKIRFNGWSGCFLSYLFLFFPFLTYHFLSCLLCTVSLYDFSKRFPLWYHTNVLYHKDQEINPQESKVGQISYSTSSSRPSTPGLRLDHQDRGPRLESSFLDFHTDTSLACSPLQGRWSPHGWTGEGTSAVDRS